MGYLDSNGLGVLWKNIVGKSIPYGYCQTAAGTKAKVVTVSPAITALETGMTIAVRFQYANTVASPTLNVNGLGAKSIYRYGTTAPSTSAASSWNANAIHTLTYNGSGWVLNNWNNTTYSSMSVAEYEAGTSGTARLITPARLKGAIEHWATGEANVQSDWGQTDSTADDFIKNKPTIPSAISPYTSNPSMDGTASAGSSNLYARGDHIHPSDTSRVPTTRTVNGKALSADVEVAGSDIKVDANNAETVDVALAKRMELVDQSTGSTNKVYTFQGYIGETLIQDTFPSATKVGNDIIQLEEEIAGCLKRLDATSSENGVTGNVFALNVSGTTAALYSRSGSTISFYAFLDAYQSIAGVTVAQAIGGTQTAPIARGYEIAELDVANYKVKLVSVDDGVIYTADLQASDIFSDLTGTFSSQTIPTGGITTETDPTVPAWAKASSKPSYGADEISFDNTQQTQYLGNATNVNTALTSLDYALDNLEHDVSTIGSDYLSKTGGTITGDLTLKSNAATNSKSIIFQRGTLTDNYNDWQIQNRGGFLYFDQRGTNSSSFSNQVCFNTSGNVQASTFNGYSLAGASAKSVDTSITSGTTSTNLPTSQAVASYVEGMFGAGLGADEIHFGGGQYYIQDLNDDTNLEQVVGTIDTYIGQNIEPNILPSVSASDNGKVLRVVNGAWSAVALPSASGVSF